MDVKPPARRGRHRRKSRGARPVLLAVCAAVLAGAFLATFLWRGEPGSEAREAAVPDVAATADGTGGRRSDPAVPADSTTPRVGPAVAVGEAPQHVQVAPDGRFAYVTDPVAGAVIRFDTARQAATATITIPEGPPRSVTFSPDGTRAYVSVHDDGFAVNHVHVLDPGTDTVVETIRVGRGPHDATTTPDGRLLYVPLSGDDHLDVIDTSTGVVVGEIATAPGPHGIAVGNSGRFGYTANPMSDSVTVVDLDSEAVVTTIPVGDGPHSLEASPDGARVAVVNSTSGDASIIDTATNRVIDTVPDVGAGSQDVAYTPDGRHLYTANAEDGTVSVVDTATGAVTARISTGGRPTAVSVLPDGRRALVTNAADGTVRIIETTRA